MQTVFDILEQQGRSALLPDTTIASILDQLRVQTNYDPLECIGRYCYRRSAKAVMSNMNEIPHCIVVGSTVTGTCGSPNENKQVDCGMTNALKATVPIAVNHTTISGTLMTSNIIMANWSRSMWQSVLNRAIRMLSGGPFRSHFFTASTTVS
ncbi:hypothetical protein KIN20_005872 [Parelaphostrongylus tenuis]|uniref:Uncharacterized protein n=1 Tax=Parelaphostrongylus tenuis TaxID=148309 RepID=A0AAD5MM53_PARTN|nr:hypothetical protein KIN20_005872 [Parelaphostrongylus tenuis]